MKLPAGQGVPAPDIQQVVAEATRACRAVSAISAEVAVSGSVGRRLRARLLVGLAAPASARVEAFTFGQPIFILVARGTDATLLLTRENRVLEHGRPAEILEAVAGVPLDASQLRTTLLGCDAGTSGAGRQIGNDWRVLAATTGESYFRRLPPDGPWRLVAVVHREPGRPEWRSEYRDFANDRPTTIRLAGGAAPRFDLRLVLSQVEVDPALPPAAFELKVPPSADPITIQELRRSGPLASE